MATGETTYLRLQLPVEGELDGQWGDVVNYGITEYVDIAIAGITVFSTNQDETLTRTEGDALGTNITANSSQYAVIKWTASNGATLRYINAPKVSKIYAVINAGTGSICFRGGPTSPTTGVTILSGEECIIAWNSSTSSGDFVKLSSTPIGTSILKGDGSGGFTNAVAGTDYLAPPSGTAILKANSGGALANAVAGTDYAPATSGTSILKGNGSGGFSNAAAGTDYAPATSGTSILYGNGSGGFSNVTIGSGVSFSLGTLSATGSGTTTAAATFNNSGSGDASGTTFNGSTARTISYNTIGAAAISGTNATGTWPISISGSASSATTATTATNATNATKLLTTNFTIEESGGKLIFKYGATTIASMTSAGVFTTLSDISSNGTP